MIDVSNATLRDQNGLPGSLLYPSGSVAERLQDALPETAVVKTPVRLLVFWALTRFLIRSTVTGQCRTIFRAGEGIRCGTRHVDRGARRSRASGIAVARR
ncbi:hypothetical protein ACMHYB_36440 [Sorangium sp. So ce1128]